METKNEHNWNKEYMPFKLWKLLNYEVRHKGDTHDVFGKALIFEVRQNPYYPEETESMLIGAVNYLGEMTYI